MDVVVGDSHDVVSMMYKFMYPTKGFTSPSLTTNMDFLRFRIALSRR